MTFTIAYMRELLEDDEMGWGPWADDAEFITWLKNSQLKEKEILERRHNRIAKLLLREIRALNEKNAAGSTAVRQYRTSINHPLSGINQRARQMKPEAS